jgi:hypothetical protein
MIVENGERYEKIIATRGKNYAMFYIYNGREFKVEVKKLQFIPGKASWFNPRNGETRIISEYRNTAVVAFDPPGEKENGNDWILILEK